MMTPRARHPNACCRKLLSRGIVPRSLLVIVATLFTASMAYAQEVVVRVKPIGLLTQRGQVATVHVTVKCPPVGDVLEALVTVSQDATYGEAYFGPVCDGVPHGQLVRVQTLDQAFQPGTAQVSPYVLVCNDAGACVAGQD